MSEREFTAEIPPVAEQYVEPPSYDDARIAARLSGYGWDEIDGFIEERSAAAGQIGYAPDEIDAFLGRPSQAGAQWRMNGEWSSRVADDETFATGLRAPFESIPLSPLEGPSALRIAGYAGYDAPEPEIGDFLEPPPASLDLADDYARGSYANALLRGEVRSPAEFAERYTAAAWSAAGTADGAAMVRAARGLAATLPSDEDFTDQAIAIAHAQGVALTPDGVKIVKQNLIDAWADTGADLAALNRRAYLDAEFGGALAKPPPEPEPMSMLARTLALPIAVGEFWKGAGFAATHGGEELKAKIDAGEVSIPEAFGLGVARIPAGMVESMWRDAKRAGEAMMGGKPLAAEEALSASMMGLRGPLVRDALGGFRPQATVINPDAPNGIEFKPGQEAFAEPKPAERVPAAADAPATTEPLPFAPEATPAEKMQALTRDWGEKPIPVDEPAFFEKMAVGQDPATIELARGMDSARGLLDYMADLGGAVMRDESGALKLGRTAAQKAEEAVRTSGRDFMQDAIIRGQGIGARETALVAHQLDPATARLGALIPRPLRWQGLADKLDNAWARVNPHMKEWENEIKKGPMGAPMRTMIGNMIEYIEGRSAGVAIRADSPLKPVADTIRLINKYTEALMRDAEAQGLHSMTSYYDDYFRHMWKDPRAVDKAFGGAGRLGSGQSFKSRSIPTIADGLAMGLEPRILHPLELTMMDAAGKIKYLHSLRILKEAENAKIVYWSSKGPLDRATDIELHGVGSRRSGNAGELKAYAHRGAATPWNDWVARGFYDRPGAASLYDKMLFMKNATVGTTLFGPMFHMVTMFGESVTSRAIQATQELTGGLRLTARGVLDLDAALVGKGVGEIARGAVDTALLPVAPVRDLVIGHREMRRYRDMVNDPVLDLLAEAGAWTGPRQQIYKMGSAPNYLESVVRRELGQDYANQLKHILERDPNGDLSALRIAGRAVGFLGREYSRILTTTTAPLFDFMTPRLKVAANFEQLQTFLRQNPTASPEAKFQAARQIVKNTDDRLGEMNMDNIFWPRMVKQLAQISMISPGWVYGYARMTTSAAGLNVERMAMERNPTATRAILAFVMTAAGINSTYQYFMTGELPWDSQTPLQDIIAPRTGGRDRHGSPERAQWPSQIKELYDYARVAMVTWHNPTAFGGAVTHYLLNKLPPSLQIGRAFITGEDAIGHHVTTSPRTFLDFMVRALTPIPMSTPAQRKAGTGIPEWQNWLLGVRPAMPHVENPNAFFKQLDNLRNRDLWDDYNRQRRENRYLETPQPLPPRPPSPERRSSQPRSRSSQPQQPRPRESAPPPSSGGKIIRNW